MTTYQSPLLTQRVPYDWEELKRSVQPESTSHRPILVQDSAPAPALVAAQSVPETQTAPASGAACSGRAKSESTAAASASPTEEELVARIVPKVLERLNSQVEIIVDVTLKTAGSRIRTDLQQAVENAVRLTVKEEFAKSKKD